MKRPRSSNAAATVPPPIIALQRSIDLVKKTLKLDATLTPADIYVHLPIDELTR